MVNREARGKLTISFPDNKYGMMWRFSKPWLQHCPGESYNHATPEEFTIVVVPYAIIGLDLCYAVTQTYRGGAPCHEFPATANVDPLAFGLQIDRRQSS
eukprot:12421848-Karenia_brevis.AAC.1